MNITEDYVSFEVAKLLKEKGFDENTEHKMWYVIKQFSTGCQWNSCTHKVGDITREYNNGCCISMPTHQMAMKWLREKYQLLISVDVSPIYGKVKDEKGKNTCGLLYWHYMASGEWMNDKYNPQQKAFVMSEKSYKKAVETALKYSLENLI